MKKSILIGVLAALMLFAFVACEQQIPTYKVPTGLSISTAKTNYIVGETLDTSAFTGTVRYSDGSSDTLAGSELSLSVPAKDGKIVANANKVTAKYGAGENAVEATAVVYGNYVSAAVIGNLPTSVAQASASGNAEQAISADGVTVTVTYAGETRELTAGEYELTLSADTTAPTAAGGTGVTIEADLEVFGIPVTTGVTTGKVVVNAYKAEEKFDSSDVQSIRVGFKDKDGNFTTTGTVWYGDATSVFAVEGTDSNGLTGILEASAYSIAVQNGNLNTTSATDVIAVLNADKTIKSPAFSVTPRNYVASISVKQNENTTVDPNSNTSSDAVKNLFTVTATMAADISEGVKTKTLANNEFTFDVPFLNSTTASSAKIIYTGAEENPAKAVTDIAVGTVTFTPAE